MTGPDGAPLPTDLWKEGGLYVFLGRLTDEAVPVPGLAELTLLRVDRDEEAHILHLLFSVLVVHCDPNQRLYRCYGELTSEGLPAITKITVDSTSAPYPGMTTGCNWRESHSLDIRQLHARGRATRERGGAFPARESPSSL